jgi:spore maturation protein SpmB
LSDGVLHASGALDFALNGVHGAAQHANLDTRFIEALPTALVKPFSGHASRAMLIETMHHSGVDSFRRWLRPRCRAVTTFYVVAVYFGAVGIRRVRHTVGCALLADLAGVLASIGVCYWFFD